MRPYAYRGLNPRLVRDGVRVRDRVRVRVSGYWEGEGEGSRPHVLAVAILHHEGVVVVGITTLLREEQPGVEV